MLLSSAGCKSGSRRHRLSRSSTASSSEHLTSSSCSQNHQYVPAKSESPVSIKCSHTSAGGSFRGYSCDNSIPRSSCSGSETMPHWMSLRSVLSLVVCSSSPSLWTNAFSADTLTPGQRVSSRTMSSKRSESPGTAAPSNSIRNTKSTNV